MYTPEPKKKKKAQTNLARFAGLWRKNRRCVGMGQMVGGLEQASLQRPLSWFLKLILGESLQVFKQEMKNAKWYFRKINLANLKKKELEERDELQAKYAGNTTAP